MVEKESVQVNMSPKSFAEYQKYLELVEERENQRAEKIEKKGIDFSKFIVLFVIVLNIGFTLGILYLFLRTGAEPSTLITCFFAFTTVELWSLSKITINKSRGGN